LGGHPAWCVGAQVQGDFQWRPPNPVGASLLAMVVNDNACELEKHGALESIASKL